MWNAGNVPARMIEIITPAGFEGFFRGFADLNDAGPIDPAEVAELAKQHGLPYADPDWLPDVIERTRLSAFRAGVALKGCPGMTSEVGSGSRFVRVMTRLVVPAGTTMRGPGTVTTSDPFTVLLPSRSTA